MDAKTFQDKYLGMNKMWGEIVGIWPPQSQRTKRIRRSIVYFFYTTCLTTQIARAIVFPTLDEISAVLPFICLMEIVVTKYTNYVRNETKLEQLFATMLRHWQQLRTVEEIKIFETFAKRGKLFTALYTANCIFCVICLCLLPIVPPVLDIIKPLNETRPKMLVFPAYYGVDQDEYFYILLPHAFTEMMFACSAYIACDANYVYFVQHACSLFDLAALHFKNSMNDAIESSKESECKIMSTSYKRVCMSIALHQQAMDFLDEIEGAHKLALFLQMGGIITCFSITLVKVSMTDLNSESFVYFTFLIVQIVHLLYVTIQGQFVTNHAEHLFKRIYEGVWYMGDPKTQRLFILALRKSMVPTILTAGGLIQLNLETFATIIKTSVSYYTVIMST